MDRELIVIQVEAGSPAEQAGIAPGATLLSVNGAIVRDALDLRFAETARQVEVVWRDPAGRERRRRIRKADDQPLGLEVDPLRMKACNNKCAFCFALQNARGMRRALYFKDDDYRFSFLNGNFATLTNLSRGDMERIVRQRLSPIYISVHATDRALRNRLLGNPNAPDVLEQIDFFATGRIRMHTQVVLCPGINDGGALEKTLADLARFHPWVETVALVPVGLTQYREKLPALRAADPTYARALLDWAAPRRRDFLRTLGTRFAHPSDEFYLLAGRPFPAARTYEGYPQLGNGVGGSRKFLDEFRRLAHRLPGAVAPACRVTVVTGTLAVPVLQGAVDRLNRIAGLCVDLVPVVNEFFGGSVSCAGLLTGRDIISALETRRAALGDVILIPAVSFKDDEDIFLDDMTLEAVGERFQLPAVRVEDTARGLVQGIPRD
jgi:putative radical SAM enzyme (TIGR03279 family)